ncbi:MAG: tetratricopeptide repeat protein [Deltaproteobacteria bacterium]|nr:tetratricopeptide repeat protein [Deltaproteobacteria bacterium]
MMAPMLPDNIVTIVIMDKILRTIKQLANNLPVAFVVLLINLGSACSFRVPTISEQKALEEMGAFPGGAPSWVSAFPANSKPKVLSGIIPNNFVQPSKQGELSPVGILTEGNLNDRQNATSEISIERTAHTPSLIGNKADSIISKIERVCSGIDGLLAQAVITEDTAERLSKYENLVKRCDKSSDLWFLLGKEYLVDGQLKKSEQALQRTIALDPNNLEAISLLQNLKTAN